MRSRAAILLNFRLCYPKDRDFQVTLIMTVTLRLINPKEKQVIIYRLNQAPEVLQSPTSLSGEYVLPGFILNLQPIFA